MLFLQQGLSNICAVIAFRDIAAVHRAIVPAFDRGHL